MKIPELFFKRVSNRLFLHISLTLSLSYLFEIWIYKLLHMKKVIFTLLLFSTFSFISNAQDTTMIEQYCKLTASGKMFSNKFHIVLDFGDVERKRHRDYRLRDEQTGKPKSFNSGIDGLNYMGAQGWILINAFPMAEDATTVSQRGTNVVHYYFKKLFKRSEID